MDDIKIHDNFIYYNGIYNTTYEMKRISWKVGLLGNSDVYDITVDGHRLSKGTEMFDKYFKIIDTYLNKNTGDLF